MIVTTSQVDGREKIPKSTKNNTIRADSSERTIIDERVFSRTDAGECECNGEIKDQTNAHVHKQRGRTLLMHENERKKKMK